MNPSFDGYEHEVINAAGTTVFRSFPVTVHTVFPYVSTGTARLFDSSTAAGTAASNLVLTVTGGTAAQDNFPRILDAKFRNGLTIATEGTPILTVTLA